MINKYMVKNGIIYMITICTSGVRYIGKSTRRVHERIYEHRKDKRRHLYMALYKNTYRVKILTTIRPTDPDKLSRLEAYYIKTLKPELNRTLIN